MLRNGQRVSSVTVNEKLTPSDTRHMVMAVGPRVFGYSDAPLQRLEENDAVFLTAVVLNFALLGNASLSVMPLFNSAALCEAESARLFLPIRPASPSAWCC